MNAKYSTYTLPILFAAMCSVVGCSKTTPTSAPEASEASSTSPVLATRGEISVTQEEFAAHLSAKKIVIRSDEQLSKALGDYLEQRALADAMVASGELDQARIDAELEAFRQQLTSAQYFDKHLKTAITREAVERYYKDHADEFSTTKFHVAHILVRTTKDDDQQARDDKRQRIDAAYRALSQGDEFALVARRFSDDKISANKGGDMGWLREGAIAPTFSQVAMALEEGTFSKPVETGFGYHILYTLDKPRVQKRPLEAVEGDIRYKLRAEAKGAERERLLGNASVKVKAPTWRPAPTEAVQKHAEKSNPTK